MARLLNGVRGNEGSTDRDCDRARALSGSGHSTGAHTAEVDRTTSGQRGCTHVQDIKWAGRSVSRSRLVWQDATPHRDTQAVVLAVSGPVAGIAWASAANTDGRFGS